MAKKKVDEAVEVDGGQENQRRVRTKSEYLIQAPRTTDGAPITVGWNDLPAGPFTDTGAALKHLRSEGLEGTFRIIAVKRTVTAEKKIKQMILFK